MEKTKPSQEYRSLIIVKIGNPEAKFTEPFWDLESLKKDLFNIVGNSSEA